MFITFTHDHVHFDYGSKRWQYNFNEITELSLLKKKKTYFLENGAFIAVTTMAYYCMFFSDLMELYYIIPALLLYTLIIISRFHDTAEFEYYVIVKDIYKKQTTVRIKPFDRVAVGKQIDEYLNIEFERLIQHTKAPNFNLKKCS